jgi:hypothetical protein
LIRSVTEENFSLAESASYQQESDFGVHQHHLPATLLAITITLFVAVAVHSPAILVAIAIPLPRFPSLLPATLIAVAITLAALSISLFVTC